VTALAGRRLRLVERSLIAYRRNWWILLSGFFEPVFFLFGLGYGVGSLVGGVTLSDGRHVSYQVFIAPALMAVSAMNGAMFESTFNLFFKLKIAKLYDTILTTPLTPGDVATGEIAWALLRGTLYAAAFVIVMAVLGLTVTPLAVLTIPGAMLIGLAFAAIGCAATTWMRWWTDFDKVNLVQLPIFLFSGTFFPVSLYPAGIRWLVELSPLYRGVHLLRGFALGQLDAGLFLDAAYLAALGAVGLLVLRRRLAGLLLT
jgi:lipooligosaccharide transport system permease protein